MSQAIANKNIIRVEGTFVEENGVRVEASERVRTFVGEHVIVPGDILRPTDGSGMSWALHGILAIRGKLQVEGFRNVLVYGVKDTLVAVKPAAWHNDLKREWHDIDECNAFSAMSNLWVYTNVDQTAKDLIKYRVFWVESIVSNFEYVSHIDLRKEG